ncbi:ester cyclase [Streptomyces sp. JJ36]|uniref:ester cyclase n=1 Tax=Streptomyces sp. JJ36 TaxID=2736645 RepID=UPI001F31DBBD|nr:ester cyclase [Streptomyces sp. JJ36]MCF6525263.1 ester cyclase [Streptomyces sp. JJ36]
MSFVQVIDCRTSRVEELNRLMDSWVEATEGKRTATHSIVAQDRADSSHVVEIVEFPSYEEAMRNSQLPETDRIFRELVAVCDQEPRFTDLEVVRDEQLNKNLVRTFFEEVSTNRSFDAQDTLCADDYREHDPTLPPEGIGREDSKAANREVHTALEPVVTLEHLIEEGDLVSAQFSFTGRHVGSLRGMEPTGREFSTTGQATFRCRNGRIAESWWNIDYLGVLRQLGAVDI